MTTRLATTPTIQVNSVSLRHIGNWLAGGWRDLWRCGWLSLVQGLGMAVFGIFLIWLFHDQFWFLAGAFSGFLVVAPVLATSLYALSRALEYRQPVGKKVLLDTWLNWQTYRKSNPSAYWSVLRFGILLAIAATGWFICSAALITLLAPTPIATPLDFVHHIVLARDGMAFEIWLMLGGVLTAPIYASSAVAIPLLLDRHISLAQAVETSWRCVLENPIVMVVWAGIIMLLTVAGMTAAIVGLAITLPWIGHASWYAYRDLVNAEQLPLRSKAGAV